MVGAGVQSTSSRERDGGRSGHCVGGEGIAKDRDVEAGDGIDGGAGG